MPTRHLITAPAGAGKTRYAIDTIRREKMLRAWQTVWVLLPTTLQTTVFQDRLLARYRAEDEPVFFGVECFQFYRLYSHLLDVLHVPHRRVDQSSVFRILRQIVSALDAQGQLPYFAPISAKPGFIDVVARFIFELKQAHTTPEDFQRYADKTGQAKDQDIARIYRTYQTFLREHDLVDREGAGWLALATLQERPDVDLGDVSLLVVDGFTQFSPLQASLLNALANNIPRTLLTLTYDKERAATLHRSLAHTRRRILDASPDDAWTEEALPSPNPQQRPELAHLEAHFMGAEADPIPAGDALHLIEAPDREAEARLVLRRVKAQLLAGEPPDEIAILARDMTPYTGLLQSVASRYGIPMIFREGPVLNQNPAVAAVLDLLRLHDPRAEYFRRQAVLDILRSPYFDTGFSQAEIDTLERLSLYYKVTTGRDRWLGALERALHEQAEQAEQAEAPSTADEEDAALDTPSIDPALRGKLEDFFACITPDAQDSPAGYITWLEKLLGLDPAFIDSGPLNEAEQAAAQTVLDDSLSFYARVRAGLDETGTADAAALVGEHVVTRDLQALQLLRRCLLDLQAAYDLLASTDAPATLRWTAFFSDLEQTLRFRQVEVTGAQYRSGHVLATSIFDGRGLPHRHIYILGLAEGEFPAQRTEDPLYSDREREAMQDSGIAVTVTTQEEDDTSLFYTGAALAQHSLTLSRPTIDDRANPWSPSVLWNAVTTLLHDADLTRQAAGQPPDLETAADYRELAVALAGSLTGDQPSAPERATAQTIAAWLAAQPVHHAAWHNTGLARHIEARRQTQFDRYSGQLEDAALLEAAAQQLDTSRVWSASQFNDYGYCPFRFFAKRLLKLEAFEEPDEGLDHLQRGALQHEVLEYTYRYFQTTELAIVPDNLPRALDILHTKATELLEAAPRRHRFRASGVWAKEKEEILAQLDAFVSADFQHDPQTPFGEKGLNKMPDAVANSQAERMVYAVELPFGFENRPPVEVAGSSGPLLARGLIDRIDRIGDQLVVIDYKSGTSLPGVKQIAEARHFQMMLYLLAARQIVEAEEPGLTVAAGVFWSIRKPETTVIISADDAVLAGAQHDLHQYIARARAGDFRVKPNGLEQGKCVGYCEFSHLCRLTRHAFHKTD